MDKRDHFTPNLTYAARASMNQKSADSVLAGFI